MPSNNDESLSTGLKFAGSGSADVIAIGNFHKTLPHNKFGEVDPAAYATFKLVASTGGDYEIVPPGYTGIVVPPEAGFLVIPPPAKGDGFNDPQAARSHDQLSGGAEAFAMGAAPKVRSKTTAAEMCELQWMAILRDVAFADFPGDTRIDDAVDDLRTQYGAALAAGEPSGVRLGLDLPKTDDGILDIRRQTLFRAAFSARTRVRWSRSSSCTTSPTGRSSSNRRCGPTRSSATSSPITGPGCGPRTPGSTNGGTATAATTISTASPVTRRSKRPADRAG